MKKEYFVPFPLSKVYTAWLSSGTVIEPSTAMDISAVVGDDYRLMMKMPEFSSNNAGKFSLVEPEKHIRYRWEWNHDGEVTEIDVSFFAIDGTTRIEIFHRSFIHQ